MADAKTTSSKSVSNPADWPRRYGKMTSLVIKNGSRRQYGIITLDCGKVQQTALIHNPIALRIAKAAAARSAKAGIQATIWMKGPFRSLDPSDHSKYKMMIIYLKDCTDYTVKIQHPQEEVVEDDNDVGF